MLMLSRLISSHSNRFHHLLSSRFRRTASSAAVAAVCLCGFILPAFGAASVQVPSGCSTLGGVMGADGVCRVSAAGINGWNVLITVSAASEGLTIQSTEEGIPGVFWGALDRQRFTITNSSAADVVIRGGDGDWADGIIETASADYSGDLTPVPGRAVFKNAADGCIVVEAGSGWNSCGIYTGAVGGGDWKMSNTGSGSILVSGGSSDLSRQAVSEWPEPKAGIMFAADNGTTDITNQGAGTVTVIGGTGGNASVTEEGTAYGIYEAATNEGEFMLRNLGTGSIVIAGGSDAFGRGISRVAVEAEALIGTASGSMTVRGGSAVGADGIGTGSIGGLWYLLNTEGAAMLIEGGTAEDAHGIRYAAMEEGDGIIGNTTAAVMTIRGGSASNAHGIATLTAADTAEAVILNESTGILTIEAGSAADANGIGAMAAAGSAYIGNDEGCVMTIRGTPEAAAIGILNASVASSATIENAGLMILNADGIGAYGQANADGTALFMNDASGTLQTEAAALFDGVEVTAAPAVRSAEVRFLTAEMTVVSQAVTVNAIDYALRADAASVKPDWAAYAVFEEGSTVRFSDITAGTEGESVIREAFESVFGTGVNLEFALPADLQQPGFADMTALISANPGAVFYETDLDTEGNAFNVTSSVGLRSVGGGTAVTVADGAQLTLLGNGRDAASVPVRVAAGGVLRLGLGTGTYSAEKGGRLRRIMNEGTLTVADGRFSAEVLDNNGTALIEQGASLTIEGRESSPSALGTLTNRGELAVHGKVEGGTVTNERGTISVTESGSVHLMSITGTGSIQNSGVLVSDEGTVTGALVSRGITDVPEYSGGISGTLEVPEGGVLMAATLNTLGVVRAGSGTLVIGTAARSAYLLSHLDEARAIVDAGGSVPQTVLDALEAEEAKMSAASFSRTGSALIGGEDDPSESSAYSQRQIQIMTEEDTSAAEVIPASEEAEEEESPVVVLAQPTVFSRLTGPSVYGAAAFAAEESARSEASSLINASDARTSGLTAKLIADSAKMKAYRMNRSGVRIGMQRAGDRFAFGAEAAFASGDLKFGGTRTRDDVSLGAYARYGTERVFLKGFAAFSQAKTELGEVPDLRTKTLFGGFDFGMEGTLREMVFTPHVGVRAYRIKTDDASDAAFAEFPIGFSVRGSLEAQSGWRVEPVAGLTLSARTGDRAVTVQSDTEVLRSVIAGRYRAEAEIGISVSNGSFEGVLGLHGAAGGEGLKAGSVQVRAAYAF